MTIEEKRERAKRYKVGDIYYFNKENGISPFEVKGIYETPRSILSEGEVYINYENIVNGMKGGFAIESFMDEHSYPKADFYKL